MVNTIRLCSRDGVIRLESETWSEVLELAIRYGFVPTPGAWWRIVSSEAARLACRDADLPTPWATVPSLDAVELANALLRYLENISDAEQCSQPSDSLRNGKYELLDLSHEDYDRVIREIASLCATGSFDVSN